MDLSTVSCTWIAILGVAICGVIGTSGNVLKESSRNRSRRHAQGRDDLRRAFIMLNGLRMASALGCQDFFLTGVYRSGLHNKLEILWLQRRQVEFPEQLAEITVDLKAILEGQGEVAYRGTDGLTTEFRVIIGMASNGWGLRSNFECLAGGLTADRPFLWKLRIHAGHFLFHRYSLLTQDRLSCQMYTTSRRNLGINWIEYDRCRI